MSHFVRILIVFLSTYAAAVQGFRPGQCDGGLTPGQIKKDSYYFYICRPDGGFSPKGCVSEAGDLIQIGERFDQGKHIILECSSGQNGRIRIKHAACRAHDGREIRPLQTWSYEESVHACHKYATGALQERLVGCFFENREVPIGQRVLTSDLWMECRIQSNGRTAMMEPIGCVDHLGVGIEWGSYFTDSDTKYYCKCSMETRSCMKRPIGCIHNGREYTAYQLIEENDQSLWRCMLSHDSSSKSERQLVGCMTAGSSYGAKESKRINCVWDDGQPPYQYVRKCVASGESSKVETLSCLYDRIAEINPGCFNVVSNGDEGAACVRKPDGRLEIQMLGAGAREVILARGRKMGLKPACWMIGAQAAPPENCCQ